MMHRSMHIKLIPSEDLTVNKKPVTNDTFVIIETDSNTTRKVETGPNWGHSKHDMIEVELPMHVGFLSLEVYCYKRKSHGNSTLIGVARIPTSDFLGSFIPDNYLHFLCYRLRDVNGVRNGIVNLSIKMASSSGYAVPKVSPAMPLELGVPVCRSKMSPRIVTGVPVWYAQPA